MKLTAKIFLSFLLCGCAPALALSGIGTNYLRLEPSVLPALCRLGDLRVSSATSDLQMCDGANTWSAFGSVSGGGTGLSTATAHGVLLGEGSNAFGFTSAGALGSLLIGQGSADPIYSSTPILGASGATGTLGFAGSTSGTVTIVPQSTAGTYNFNLPITAGTSGQVLTSGGGGSNPMSFGAVGVVGGGTGLGTLTLHSVQVGNGTSAITQVPVSASTVFPLVSGGSSADPAFSLLSVAGGGSGLATRTIHALQVGNSTSAITQLAVGASGTLLTGVASSDPAFSATPTLGVAGTTLGTVSLAGNTSGAVTIQPQAAAGTYNFNLPTTAGTSGFALLSGGGSSSPMTWASVLSNPMTTGGDIIYGGSSGTATRLANGSAGQILTSAGSTSAPTWASFKAPTVQKFTTSGSFTYTVPTSPAPLYIRVRGVGGGGGGAGSGTGTSAGATAGGTTSFGTSLLSAGGGAAGNNSAGGTGGTGGSFSLGSGPVGLGVVGGSGGPSNFVGATNNYVTGGNGGSSPLGGAGSGGAQNTAGQAGVANTGGGGGGGGSTQLINMVSGSGGGSGGFFDALISGSTLTGLGATPAVVVGASGAAGAAGTGTGASTGAAGGTGQIVVEEYYQ